mmetsp:Transcript_52119/g.117358  ORF Transcript_52119/g.117358 Transcript_52119/m.117358 type:complete len:160 (-) Transcript_52119:78-557(-)
MAARGCGCWIGSWKMMLSGGSTGSRSLVTSRPFSAAQAAEGKTALRPWDGQVMVDLCIVPIGQGVSVRKEVAAVEGLLREHEAKGKLKCQLHPYGTNIQGDWDVVMDAIKQAHSLLHDRMDVARISSSWRVGTRVDKAQTMEEKVAAVEEILKQQKCSA